MTPDQLPAGLRVKALEWNGNWCSQYKVIALLDGGATAFVHLGRNSYNEIGDFPNKEAAKTACQRHHEEQVCAQLEIVNG